MYDGNQVLRFEKYKKQDIGGLSVELTDRKGTGNYDIERHKYNYDYVSMDKNLLSSTYKKLKDNNIEFNANNKNINLLNGVVITSGKEFFESLGLKFVDSGRKNKAGSVITTPLINSKEDIPDKLYKFFDDSFEFISNYVGKDNIVYASVHLDEDTPHMQVYFLPVVSSVQRKVFKTDDKGKRVLEERINKKGEKKLVPVQLKDENGKNVYKTIEGKFLDNDQFWKQKGGKQSFALAQDEFNEFINSKGYNLYRGAKGSNRKHLTKAEFEIKSLNSEISKLNEELLSNQEKNKILLESSKKLVKREDINIKKKFGVYSNNDVNNLIDYSTNLSKDNIYKDSIIKQKESDIKSKDKKIDKLNNEIINLKSNKVLMEKDKIIESQQNIIEENKNTINSLQKEIVHLKEQIKDITKSFEHKLRKLCLALGTFIKRRFERPDKSLDFDRYVSEANKIISHNNDRQI